MSTINPKPEPVKLQCLACKSEGGDFWVVTPSLPYTNPNQKDKNPQFPMTKTLQTIVLCPVCDTPNTIYWDIPNPS